MKIAIPDKISPSYFIAEAAVELGFFKAEGLDVSLELVYPVDTAYEALRDGKIDFVGGAAHAVPSAFPRFKGAKLIAAQAQGMYWFLVMRSDIGARRGAFNVVKGRAIGEHGLARFAGRSRDRSRSRQGHHRAGAGPDRRFGPQLRRHGVEGAG